MGLGPGDFAVHCENHVTERKTLLKHIENFVTKLALRWGWGWMGQTGNTREREARADQVMVQKPDHLTLALAS